MALTAAERQRAYKARKKAEGVDFAKVQREWRAENKDKVKKHNATQKENGNKARYWKGPAGKANSKRAHEKTMQDAGKRRMLSIGARINESMHDPSTKTSKFLKKYTEFSTKAEVKNHIESLLGASWMTWENYGHHNADGVRKWHVGHRIPRIEYDGEDLADLRRCWSRANLFPQDADENFKLNDAVPAESTLLPLRHVWPLRWKDQLPSQ